MIQIDCTWLEVPIDHAHPGAGVIRLAASRIGATDAGRRIGVLVTIAGGPGQRGTDGIRHGTQTPVVHGRFDIVSWDPRGTSHESIIDCIPQWGPFAGLDRTPDAPSEQRALDGRVAALAMRCRDAHGDLLPYIGMLETALDLERLRQMLGEDRISLLGSSYGPGGRAGRDRALSQSDAHEALVGYVIRDDRVRARLLDALASAARGDGGPLLAIADQVRHDYESTGLSQGVFMAIYCSDTAGF